MLVLRAAVPDVVAVATGLCVSVGTSLAGGLVYEVLSSPDGTCGAAAEVACVVSGSPIQGCPWVAEPLVFVLS